MGAGTWSTTCPSSSPRGRTISSTARSSGAMGPRLLPSHLSTRRRPRLSRQDGDHAMAITEPISNPAVTEVRRTARASIEVPRNGPGEFVIYREKQHLDADENIVLIETSQVAVRRGFSQIAEETVTVDEIELTGMQVVQAL